MSDAVDVLAERLYIVGRFFFSFVALTLGLRCCYFDAGKKWYTLACMHGPDMTILSAACKPFTERERTFSRRAMPWSFKRLLNTPANKMHYFRADEPCLC